MNSYSTHLSRGIVAEKKNQRVRMDETYANTKMTPGSEENRKWGFVADEGVAVIFGKKTTFLDPEKTTLSEVSKLSGHDVEGTDWEVKCIPPGRENCAVPREQLDKYSPDQVIIVAKVFAHEDGSATVKALGWCRAIKLQRMKNSPKLTYQVGVLFHPDERGLLSPMEELPRA